jgi:hypothetical protein
MHRYGDDNPDDNCMASASPRQDDGMTRRRLLAASAQATAVLAGTASGLAVPSRAWASPAELLRNPFNKLSAHHRPVGRGLPGKDAVNNPDAYYGIPGTTGPATRGRMAIVTSVTLQGPVGLKFMRQVSPSDPYWTINKAANSLPGPKPPPNLPFTLCMPTTGPYPPEMATPMDCNIFLYPRDGLDHDVGDLFNQFRYYDRQAQHHYAYGLVGLDHVGLPDGGGRGTSASKVRWPSSLLLCEEMAPADPAPIRHCLNVLATRKNSNGAAHVVGKNRVWPTYGVDSGASNADQNLGDIPYGTRFVIRWQDGNLRDSLALTARGKVLFDCLLYYGFYVLDGSTETGPNGGGKIGFRTDQAPTANGDWPWALKQEVAGALKKLVPLCWPVRSVRPDGFETEIHSDGLPYGSGGGPLGPGSVNSAWDA